ncbi:MAG: Carboxy-terminal processing protease CtpB precursor [Parcubacteria group bacterium ADurb.Bin159]|jgi:carboxyl-terminal processing protease|nr:MAG: Carboxy-terminal processing protease CtpB precursor [Parcubacteria group bacterium ADurb.Bin159]
MNKKSFILSLVIIFFIALGLGIILGSIFYGVGVETKSVFNPFVSLGAPLKYQTLFEEVYSAIKTQYIVPSVDDDTLYYGALEGMVNGLEDPYSVFLKPDLAKMFEEDISGNFEGVGMEIGIKNNQLTVIAPLPGTPAERAGLRTGDEIYAIDGEATAGLSIDMATLLIRGKKGTPVTLTIWREGWETLKDIEIIRDTIKIQSVKWEKKTPTIAYLRIVHFSENTLEEFEEAVEALNPASLKGIILDLRNNPGGYLDTAVDIAGWWVEENKEEIVVSSKNNIHQIQSYKTKSRGNFANLKTVVLINNGSASGAEILAGALQDWGKATLVGETTFGKGSVQVLIPMADGSALKLTAAYWYTPKDRSIEKMGIEPDIKIEFTEEDYLKEKDPQLEKAMEILEGAI